MTTEHAGLIEMGLVFGAALALLFYELWSVRRSQRKDREAASDAGRRRDGAAGPGP